MSLGSRGRSLCLKQPLVPEALGECLQGGWMDGCTQGGALTPAFVHEASSGGEWVCDVGSLTGWPVGVWCRKWPEPWLHFPLMKEENRAQH